MSREIITLNKALSINNNTTKPPQDNSLINYFVAIAVLAETAVSKGDDYPWLTEKKLNKRRNGYEFDKHLQNMLLFIDGRNDVSAKCIECGASNYYKTEIILDNSIYVHFCHSFDRTAKYNKPYLLMNEDSSKFNFCCFEYTLSADKTKIIDISLLIPRLNNKDIRLKLNIDFKAIKDSFNSADITIEKRLELLNWHQKKEDVSKSDNTEE